MYGCLSTVVAFGVLGYLDDRKKIREKDGLGIRARYKFPLQFAIGLIVSLILFYGIDHDSRLIFPFFKRATPDLGDWYVLFATLVIVGSANAVNLTDGLDGWRSALLITARSCARPRETFIATTSDPLARERERPSWAMAGAPRVSLAATLGLQVGDVDLASRGPRNTAGSTRILLPS
jgi:hypothetical protein